MESAKFKGFLFDLNACKVRVNAKRRMSKGLSSKFELPKKEIRLLRQNREPGSGDEKKMLKRKL